MSSQVYASPISIRATPGQLIDLGQVVNQIFAGTTHSGFSFDMFDNSDGPAHSTGTGYWNIGAPMKAALIIGGVKQPTVNQHASIFVNTDQLSSVQLVAGNQIGAGLNVITTMTGSDGKSFTSNLRIDVIPSGIYSDPTPEKITGSDVAAAALAFGNALSGSLSPFGCQIIARDFAAAVGAPLPYMSESLVPSENQDQGFWHVVHRGDQNPTPLWESLLQPGDIVRFDYSNPLSPQHTFTVISVSGGLVETFDNFNGVDVQHHSFDYSTVANPATVTIYRLDDSLSTATMVRNLYQSVLNSTPSDADIVVVTGKIDAGIMTLADYQQQLRALVGDHIFNSGPGNQTFDGGIGNDTVIFSGSVGQYSVQKVGNTFTVTDGTANRDGTDTLINIEHIQFTDRSINLTMPAEAAKVSLIQLNSVTELYVAYFNRVPEASGLAYWIDKVAGGESLTQVSQEFYAAGVQFSNVSGYSANMTNADFIKIVYSNVLGRTGATAPSASEIDYWDKAITAGAATKENLIQTMLTGAHTYANDPTWSWVTHLLDNKVAVGLNHAVTLAVDYNTSTDAITQTVAIAHAVTPTDTIGAINLIGLSNVHLV